MFQDQTTIKTLHKVGAFAAMICSACYIIGLYTIIYVAPDLYQLPEGRLRVIDEYGNLLYLWYFIVFGVVGICVVLVNHTLLESHEILPNGFTILTTLTAFLSASYLFIICSIEIFSNIFFIAEHQGDESARSALTTQLYSILISLRSYTEWTLDVWLILINSLLFQVKRISAYLSSFGIGVGIFGILILHPILQKFALYYVGAIATWFMLISLQLFSTKSLIATNR